MSNGKVHSELDPLVFVDLVTNKNYRIEKDDDGNEIKREIRQSRIRKRISRTVQTAKFESIVIDDEVEEVIEWTTFRERNTKIRNWDTAVVNSYKVTYNNVMDELGLSHKKAYFKDAPQTDPVKDPVIEADLADLEDLDVLD